MNAVKQGAAMGTVATFDATNCVGCYAEGSCDSYCYGVAFSPAATKATSSIALSIKKEELRREWVTEQIRQVRYELSLTTDVEQRKFTRRVLKTLRNALK